MADGNGSNLNTNVAILQTLTAIQQQMQQMVEAMKNLQTSQPRHQGVRRHVEGRAIPNLPLHENVPGSDSDEENQISDGEQGFDPPYPKIKADLPFFSGNLDVEDFLDWVAEVEKYFELMSIAEHLQVKYVAYKLRGGASAWWEQLQGKRRRQHKQPIRSWRRMKEALMFRFLPSDYDQILYQRYQDCKQGVRTVQQYTEEFHRLSARNNLSETEAQQTARFMSGLRTTIRDRVELAPVYGVDEAINRAMKVEAQLNRATRGQPTEHRAGDSSRGHNQGNRPNTSQIESSQPFGKKTPAESSKMTEPSSHNQLQGGPQNRQNSNPYARERGNKCYRCNQPGHLSNNCPKRGQVNMVEHEDGFEATEEHYTVGPDDVYEEDEQAVCVVRKLALTMESIAEDPQRHNLFRTSCKVNQRVFEVIVDGGSQENLISREMVNQLKLKLRKHPHPYKNWVDQVYG
ncbi:uncharacterized protein LOC120258941 [Dioscorea cayenensis subsp. rotundata]|uniref:Uncharacterized protein LOC120258941 n=1 Tax=Dioscorea cayennensis subsp. rotundata TaxID=55577 RepID=A0AB40B522_DIOCR|nr:uncharacterized protein LOC120258941 [Dioscorea cayenensis subsp. rotundata]